MKKGFTLVELLVVISIIAILSVVGMTIYTGVQKNARDAVRKGDIDSIVKALEANRTDSGYILLNDNQFTNNKTPVSDPQGIPYCANTSVVSLGGSLPNTPTASWNATNGCPSGYSQVSTDATNGKPPVGTSWKVCTWLESGSAYCRTNAQ